METQTQLLLHCKDHHCPDNNLPHGEGQGIFVPSSSEEVQKPAKRPTRQWAAWTREEEESFFTALRQVGKNFEKITSRVQSKNKDQVRHYYYRLVRRMNKLLGPGFLDAKNSKDTNAAMLRWWSLLEKYSCKASKLHHLKPRRFKIFIETLEHQLLKDRKKNVRKRPCQAENCPPSPSRALPNQNKLSGNETRAIKFILVDSQNIQKTGNGRGSTLRRSGNLGVNRSRGDLSPTKVSRQRRKPGGALSAAAVKKWEKAAIAGMSLVAEAAEHIERTAGGKEGAENCGMLNSSSAQPAACNNGERGLERTSQIVSTVPNFACTVPQEKSAQDITKLKLQLFPIDDVTRRTLEMDKHNPHLELTLSTRKKITSVLEHLNRKWGCSAAACGELMLFPYTAQRDSSFHCDRWSQSSLVSAADVYNAVGSPPVFRLRYGWFPTSELRSSPSSSSSDKQDMNKVNQEHQSANPTGIPESWVDQFGKTLGSGVEVEALTARTPDAGSSMADSARHDGFGGPKDSDLHPEGFGASLLWQRSPVPTQPVARETKPEGMANISAQPAAVWTDSITNISVGDLLADDVEADCEAAPVAGPSHCVEEVPFSCDSFDAAIAAHLLKHQNKTGFHSATTTSHTLSSIWDAEETCDAFSFQNRSSIIAQVQNPPVTSACVEDLPEEEMGDADTDTDAKGEPMDEEEGPSDTPGLLENTPEDLNALTDAYWPDSLGPLDLDALCSSKRYYSQEIVFSDSLGGLSRLIASSLDAFQNCSFFSLENRKEAEATPGGQEAHQGNTSSASNYRSSED